MTNQPTTSIRHAWKVPLVLLCFMAPVLLVLGMFVARLLQANETSVLTSSLQTQQARQNPDALPQSLKPYFALTSPNADVGNWALAEIKKDWHPGSTTMLVEVGRYCRNQETFDELCKLADAQTGNSIGTDIDKWRDWIWQQDYNPHPEYAKFQKHLYGKIDARFREYFEAPGNPKIRLDEIRWGGVVRDGIPPLKNPKMISANTADYLNDTDVVFGITINGDSRCYPKRILAWHEMFKDTIGGQSVAGVY